jgi:PqqD family protein of HPr-rel-A system
VIEAGADRPDCYAIPPGVEYLRWPGDSDWVIYHTGTGETLRVSDLALAILDAVARRPALNREGLITALTTLFDEPPEAGELRASLDEHLRLLLSHECIEVRPCASAN